MLGKGSFFAVAALACAALAPAPAFAQRYLTEFVGTTRVTATVGTVAIDSSLDFDTQSGRRLVGGFSYLERSGLTSEVELFSADATLAASGQCPARLQGSDASGSLHLVERPFDAEVFALLGGLDLTSDGGSVKLTSGRLRGPGVFLRPPAEALKIALGDGQAVLRSTSSGEENKLTLVAEREGEGKIAHGTLDDMKSPTPSNVVLSASDDWFYFLAVNDGDYILARGAVEVDKAGQAIGTAEGTYERISLSGKTIDGGVIRIEIAP